MEFCNDRSTFCSSMSLHLFHSQRIEVHLKYHVLNIEIVCMYR